MTLVIEIANLLSAQHTTTTMVISSNCTASDILRRSLLSRWRALYVLWPLILRSKQSAKNGKAPTHLREACVNFLVRLVLQADAAVKTVTVPKSLRILHDMLALSGWVDVGVRPQIFDRMLTLVSHSFSLLDPIRLCQTTNTCLVQLML